MDFTHGYSYLTRRGGLVNKTLDCEYSIIRWLFQA